MQSASAKTYISKHKIEAYKQRRSQNQSQQQPQLAKEEEKPKELPEIKEDVKMEEQENAEQNQVSAQNDQNQADKAQEGEALPQAEEPKKSGMMAGLYAGIKQMLGSKQQQPQAPSSQPAQQQAQPKLMKYDSAENSAEEVDSDDLEGDLNLSDDEDMAAGQAKRGQMRQQREQERKAFGQEKHKYKVEVDTNVFEVQFACLKDDAEPATGDPTACAHCKAIFNSLSKFEVNAEGKQIWTCEFCNHKNEVDLDKEEIPKTNQVSYLLEAPAQVKQAKKDEEKKEEVKEKVKDETSVVFCLDISGSMGQQIQMPREKNIRGQQRYTRLDCMKAAVIGQVDQMNEKAQDRKVGVVAFDNQVDIIGDANEKIETVDQSKYYEFDWLLQNGKEQADIRLTKTIKDSHAMLKEAVSNQKQRGATALGPAVLTSVAMAAKGNPGSTVVICTDGMSNNGIGSAQRGFMRNPQQDAYAEVDKFYEDVGTFAKSHGVTINIVAIEGDECNLQSLSKLCELTGGMVDKVNPTNLKENFANFLSNPVIATNVVCKVKLHKGLCFRNELESNISEAKTLLTREFGNVIESVVFTFEYTSKPIEELLEMEDIDFEKLKSFPFQAQICYTSLSGAKMVRVVTQTLEISSEKEEIQKKADFDMMNRNCIQQASKIARGGDVRKAQAMAKGYFRAQRSNNSECAQQAKSSFTADFNQVYGALDMQNNMQRGSMPMQQQMPRQRKMMNRGPPGGAPPQRMMMKCAPMGAPPQMAMNSMPMDMGAVPQKRMMKQKKVAAPTRGSQQKLQRAMSSGSDSCDSGSDDCLDLQKESLMMSAAPMQMECAMAAPMQMQAPMMQMQQQSFGGQQRQSDMLSNALFQGMSQRKK